MNYDKNQYHEKLLKTNIKSFRKAKRFTSPLLRKVKFTKVVSDINHGFIIDTEKRVWVVSIIDFIN